jgi:hypothetical protein
MPWGNPREAATEPEGPITTKLGALAAEGHHSR